MNNNRNNNRRRGRGNRQQGGGNQNRIDSRARGNAPQMLDKYKKLAQDAAHNGDRVQAEYYLQFADHYFRVIADNKSRQDDQRGSGRRDERDYQSDDEGDEDDFDAPRQQFGNRNDRPGDRSSERQGERQNDRYQERPRQRQRADEDYRPRDEAVQADEGDDAGDFVSTDNPFTRGQERDRRPAREPDGAEQGRRGRGRRNARPIDNEVLPDNAGEIDSSALPPSFSAGDSEDSGDTGKRKLPPRRRRPADKADEGGETLKAVG